MAHTAHKTKEAMQEHLEGKDSIDKKAKMLADLIDQSNHVCFFYRSWYFHLEWDS